jgi:hypothetical protein
MLKLPVHDAAAMSLKVVVMARKSAKSGPLTGARSPGCRAREIAAIVSASRYGSGRRSSESTTEKIVVAGPMPMARVTTITIENDGVFTNVRRAKRTSRRIGRIAVSGCRAKATPRATTHQRLTRGTAGGSVPTRECAVPEMNGARAFSLERRALSPAARHDGLRARRSTEDDNQCLDSGMRRPENEQ